MSYDPVPDGELAAVVTYLEMLEPPADRPPRSPLRLQPMQRPPLDDYRRLFRLVGAPWLWFSRLAMAATLGAESDPRGAALSAPIIGQTPAAARNRPAPHAKRRARLRLARDAGPPARPAA